MFLRTNHRLLGGTNHKRQSYKIKGPILLLEGVEGRI